MAGRKARQSRREIMEHVNGRTMNGVPPGFAHFTTDGYYVTAGYFLMPKKLQAVVQS